VDAETTGDNIGIVVRLTSAAEDGWRLLIDGTPTGALDLPLRPLTMVVRLRRLRGSGLLRGQLLFPESGANVPFQSGAQLEAIVRAWLLDEEMPTAAQ